MTYEEAKLEIEEEFKAFLCGIGLEDEEYLAKVMDKNPDLKRVVEANRMAIKALEQEPKIGYWILKKTFPTKLYDEYLNEYKCSECYREIRCTESQLVNYPFCHCGARMFEPQESEG